MDEIGGAAEVRQSGSEMDAAWAVFGLRLAAYLSTMNEAGEDDCLVLDVPAWHGAGEGEAPSVRFLGGEAGTGLRAEVPSNQDLAVAYRIDSQGLERLETAGWTLTRADEEDATGSHWTCAGAGAAVVVAESSVSALRDVFGIPDPGLLTARAWGPASSGVSVLRLAAPDEVPADLIPVENRPDPAPDVVFPSSPAVLAEEVEAVLRRRGEEWELDEDGDFRILHNAHPVWVHVSAEEPALEISVVAAMPVVSRRQAAIECNLLNRDHGWIRWMVCGRSVVQMWRVNAFPFVDLTLDRALTSFLEIFDETHEALVDRLLRE